MYIQQSENISVGGYPLREKSITRFESDGQKSVVNISLVLITYQRTAEGCD